VHVAHREDKVHACKVLAGKSKRKRLLGRPRHGSIILKWVFADYKMGNHELDSYG
jgi:hypothetical protein